jgi:TRAP-type C4-dicarboxylate transport system substrate-binding protein
MRRAHLFAAATALALGIAANTAAAAGPEHTLRIATVAPKNSSWGKVFATWQKAIEKKTDDRVKLDVFFNGVQGNEDAMVSKLKTGQLDGAAIGAIGLSMIYKQVLVLQLPGVFENWKQLDDVRAKVQQRLDDGIRQQGFTIVGWGDVGLVRQFTKGFEIRRPEDVRNRHPAVWRNEPVGPALYAAIGSNVPVPVDVMEMLPQLRSGNVNIIVAPALAAEQLQWTPYLDHVNDEVIGCAVGALIFKTGVLEALPPDLRALWDDVQKRASETQQGKIRKLDEEAYGRILQKMIAVKLTKAERDEWEKMLRKVTKSLAHGTYDLNLVNEVLKMRGYDPV